MKNAFENLEAVVLGVNSMNMKCVNKHFAMVGHATGACAHHTWSYRTPAGTMCCDANSVGNDRQGWFKATVGSVQVAADVATISFSLSYKAVSQQSASQFSWRSIRWSDLGVMHGRRVHISAITDDLQHAWHEHPEVGHSDDTQMRVRLRLPPVASGSVRVRLLFNFGLLADKPDVDMCVSESAVHMDPGQGTELTVEGDAMSDYLTLRSGHTVAPTAQSLEQVAAQSTSGISLEGPATDEIADHQPIRCDVYICVYIHTRIHTHMHTCMHDEIRDRSYVCMYVGDRRPSAYQLR